MNLTYRQLKTIFPELNAAQIRPSRIINIFESRNIELREVKMEGRGGCVTDCGREIVFLRNSLTALLRHHTLAYESVHAFSHAPAPFLRWRHNLESAFFSLMFMMPRAELPHLNRIKHQLDDEHYDLLMQRNKGKEIWNL